MTNQPLETINCELCLIGTGVSGLNALSSSSEYLSKDDKIIVVDKRVSENAIGGMWNSAYPFVRLHQPHPLFTVGNMKWNSNHNPSYLAKKEEIIEHFNSCYGKLKNKFLIIEKFGYEYLNHKEVKSSKGYEVHINFASVQKELPPLVVKAKRCIKAIGFNVRPSQPMKFSSDNVHSITPESNQLISGQVANDDKPIYIVGGGKTSMDVAGLILSQNPKRRINFIIGKGTYFLNRDVFFPVGSKKNWSGIPLNKSLLDIAMHYDDDNIDKAIEVVKEKYCLSPFKDAKHSVVGLLSPGESERVKKAVDEEVYDYLEDVSNEEGKLRIHYRSGNSQEIDSNSWFINCSGYLYSKPEEVEPILSPHKTVLSIQKTMSSIIFTTFAGYFLPHLWYRDKFQSVSINQFNHLELTKKGKESFLFAISAQAIHNLIYFIEALPLSVVYNCGLNFDKWFPLHRQAPVLLKILMNKKKYLDHTAKLLDNVSTKYEIESSSVGH